MIVKILARLGLAILLSAAGAALVNAQEPSAGSVAMAREMLVLKGGNTFFERLVPGVIESAKNSFIPTNPQFGKPLDEVADGLQKELASKSGEIVTDVARIYAQHFSDQELKEILAFYKTPTGKKMLAEEPQVINESMKYAQNWANDLYEKVLGRFRTEMKKKGYDL
jgi:uncharacterized protein